MRLTARGVIVLGLLAAAILTAGIMYAKDVVTPMFAQSSEPTCIIIAEHEVRSGQTVSEILLDPKTYSQSDPKLRPNLRSAAEQLDDWEFLVVQANNLQTAGGTHGGQTLDIPSPDSTNCRS